MIGNIVIDQQRRQQKTLRSFAGNRIETIPGAVSNTACGALNKAGAGVFRVFVPKPEIRQNAIPPVACVHESRQGIFPDHVPIRESTQPDARKQRGVVEPRSDLRQYGIRILQYRSEVSGVRDIQRLTRNRRQDLIERELRTPDRRCIVAVVELRIFALILFIAQAALESPTVILRPCVKAKICNDVNHVLFKIQLQMIEACKSISSWIEYGIGIVHIENRVQRIA